MTLHAIDAHEILDLAKNAAGFVVATARISRAGIQKYAARELGDQFKDRAPDAVIRVYRPPEEVFATESLDSLKGLPLTIEHQDGFVTPGKARKQVVGSLGDTITQDGSYVGASVFVTHEDGIKALEHGKRELSIGYDFDLDVESGTTPDGAQYDAVMRNIRGNHVSIVSRGRGGPECRVHTEDGENDSTRGTTMARMIDCNGIQIEVSDQAAQAFAHISGDLQARDAELVTSKETLKARDAELAKRDATIETLTAKVAELEKGAGAEALDAAVEVRQTLVEDARKLAPKLEPKGLDSMAIRRAALKVVDVDLDGRSDDYVMAAFDVRVDAAGKGKAGGANDAAKVVEGMRPTVLDASGAEDGRLSARDAWMKRTSEAHQAPAAEG